MDNMFPGALSFNQNLCSWKFDFPYGSTATFGTATACTFPDDPKEDNLGPFCANDCKPSSQPSLCPTKSFAPSLTPSLLPSSSPTVDCHAILGRKKCVAAVVRGVEFPWKEPIKISTVFLQMRI